MCISHFPLMCSYAYIMLDQTQIDLNRYFISPAKNYQEHIFFIYKGYGGLSLGYLAKSHLICIFNKYYENNIEKRLVFP